MKNKRAVIAGAGTMGVSIAQVYALGGWDTVLYNRSESGLERAEKMIGLNQSALISQGIISPAQSEEMKSRLLMATDKGCCGQGEIVVECIAEDMGMKQDFWREASRLAPEEALLATNSSGLKISEIAKAVHLPRRFMGQHWLNPAHLLPLCELVVGEETGGETVEKMRELILALGKRPVVVKDINGFIVNRLQFALLREALYIVESGAAGYEDVDQALKGGLGLRYAALGAFAVADLGGLDVFKSISDYLNPQLCGDRETGRALKELVEQGRLGVKSGAGFYDYPGDGAEKAIEERDRLYIKLAKALYFDKED